MLRAMPPELRGHGVVDGARGLAVIEGLAFVEETEEDDLGWFRRNPESSGESNPPGVRMVC